MKVLYFVVFFCAFSSIFAKEYDENLNQQLLPLRALIPLKEVFDKLDKDNYDVEGALGAIEAAINQFVDKLFKNINEFSVKNGLDPVSLDDMKEDFLGVHIRLNNGSLHGISSINRTNDAVLRYSTQTKILNIEFPIDLNNIYFLYHFDIRMLIIHIQGHMRGSIKDFKALLKFSFDFNNYNATVDAIDTKGMGPITLTFDDKGLIAEVVNILSKFVTAVLHPLLEGIIRGIISNVCHSVVDALNKEIDGFLHPNTTNITLF